MSQKTRMNLAALTFARAAGVEPHLENWPHLRRALLFGPLAPSCFRLRGSRCAARRRRPGSRAMPPLSARSRRTRLTEREQRYWSLVEARSGHALSAVSPITFRARSSLISSSVKPRPRSTSSLCCPASAAGTDGGRRAPA